MEMENIVWGNEKIPVYLFMYFWIKIDVCLYKEPVQLAGITYIGPSVCLEFLVSLSVSQSNFQLGGLLP